MKKINKKIEVRMAGDEGIARTLEVWESVEGSEWVRIASVSAQGSKQGLGDLQKTLENFGVVDVVGFGGLVRRGVVWGVGVLGSDGVQVSCGKGRMENRWGSAALETSDPVFDVLYVKLPEGGFGPVGFLPPRVRL